MASIEIRTTQNVTITYELANVRDRLFAFLIDFFLIATLYYILLVFLISTVGTLLSAASGLLLSFLVYFLPLFIFLFYCFSFEVYLHGQTIGKRMIGIKVVRLDGKEPGLTDYLLRSIFYLIDVVFSSGIIASLLIGSTPRHQRLGDLTAHTTVIRVPSNLPYRLRDVLRIESLEDYEPQYPGIRQVSEQDMLLVKTALARYQSFPNNAHREVLQQLANRLASLLELPQAPADKVSFLKTLIRDYVVLTR
ncbi:MAG: RDD family protein [Saprospirales bacterium]|nr:RDD family protein [Saprospirales bacterium]MBK8490090.1 RDD family protein [Saprospirales bacterium]